MSYRYEIDKKNAISMWDDSNPNPGGEPFLFQPEWPNGTPWASKAEAETWAKAFIETLENAQSEFVAGDSPEEPLKPRVFPEAAE